MWTHYQRRRSHGSSNDAKISSTNSSKNDGRVTVTQVVGASKEVWRERTSGSANGRGTATCRTRTGTARALFSCRSYRRRRSGSASVSYASRARWNSTGEEPALDGVHVAIRLDLGLGDARASYLTSDLSYDYVRINADYRS